jgi:GT2 family glycosyltransferase
MMFEVIIPHYSRLALLRQTLDALRRQSEPVPVCVVDNGSQDDTIETLSSTYPEVRLVSLPTNVGFGCACNGGIDSSDAEYVILLNNDAVPDRQFVAELRRVCEDFGRPQMVVPCLLQPGGLVDSYGIELDQSFNAFDVARGGRYDAVCGPGQPRAFAPTGGAGVYARERLLSVGGFDRHIFAYLEDVDLGLRLWLAGARVTGAPRAKATHAHSATLGSGSSQKNYLLAKNKVYLTRKYRRFFRPSTVARAVATEGIVSLGKVAVDRNAAALYGWTAGWRMTVVPVPGAVGALDELLQPRGFADGIRVRRQSRAKVVLGS